MQEGRGCGRALCGFRNSQQFFTICDCSRCYHPLRWSSVFMFFASKVRNLSFTFTRMRDCCSSRRPTMSFASLGKAATNCRQGLLLTCLAVSVCVCPQLRSFLYAQDVPAAPAAQPV